MEAVTCPRAGALRRYFTMAASERISRALSLCLLTAFSGALAGCGGDGTASLGNRLWIDHVPADRRDPIAAVTLGEAAAGGKTAGVFYRGSIFRGTFDTFTWKQLEEGRAELSLLQEEKTVTVRIEGCEPDDSFDYCVLIHGDPQGVRRYQSRKRWGAHAGPAVDLSAALREALGDDPELAPLFADP